MPVRSNPIVVGSPLLLLFVLATSCSSPPPPVDLENARSTLLAADMAWSTTPPDADAFVAMMDEDASFLAPDAPQANGQEDIKAAVSGLFASPGFKLNWRATSAEVASSGDFGYTLGTFELTLNDADGNPQTRQGKYVTVWEKNAEGQWKVLADIPNFNSPPPAPAMESTEK